MSAPDAPKKLRGLGSYRQLLRSPARQPLHRDDAADRRSSLQDVSHKTTNPAVSSVDGMIGAGTGPPDGTPPRNAARYNQPRAVTASPSQRPTPDTASSTVQSKTKPSPLILPKPNNSTSVASPNHIVPSPRSEIIGSALASRTNITNPSAISLTNDGGSIRSRSPSVQFQYRSPSTSRRPMGDGARRTSFSGSGVASRPAVETTSAFGKIETRGRSPSVSSLARFSASPRPKAAALMQPATSKSESGVAQPPTPAALDSADGPSRRASPGGDSIQDNTKALLAGVFSNEPSATDASPREFSEGKSQYIYNLRPAVSQNTSAGSFATISTTPVGPPVARRNTLVSMRNREGHNRRTSDSQFSVTQPEHLASREGENNHHDYLQPEQESMTIPPHRKYTGEERSRAPTRSSTLDGVHDTDRSVSSDHDFNRHSTYRMGSSSTQNDPAGRSGRKVNWLSKAFRWNSKSKKDKSKSGLNSEGASRSNSDLPGALISTRSQDPYDKSTILPIGNYFESTGLENQPSAPPQMGGLGVTLSSDMDAVEIIDHLRNHRCKDITSAMNASSFSQHPISTGGFGDVYRGELNDGAHVAIKVLRFSGTTGVVGDKSLKQAAREIYTWSKCHHPNVSHLLGLTIFRDQIAMVSKWMEKGNLPGYISKNPSIDRCKLCIDICDGLLSLHADGIIHGDLKGANVLVSDDEMPIITDFGNAILQNYTTLNFTATDRNKAISARWTAPELMDERDGTHSKAADVYALGMTILEIISGKHPFEDRSDFQVIHTVTIRRECPIRPEVYIPSSSRLGNVLWALLKGCWDFEPSRRPTASEVAAIMRGMTRESLLVIEAPAPSNALKSHE